MPNSKPVNMPKGYFGWSLIDGERGITTLKDALNNLSTKLNADNHEYAKGVLVGVVSTLMACGMDFHDATQLAWQTMPKDIDPRKIPNGWHNSFGMKEPE